MMMLLLLLLLLLLKLVEWVPLNLISLFKLLQYLPTRRDLEPLHLLVRLFVFSCLLLLLLQQQRNGTLSRDFGLDLAHLINCKCVKVGSSPS